MLSGAAFSASRCFRRAARRYFFAASWAIWLCLSPGLAQERSAPEAFEPSPLTVYQTLEEVPADSAGAARQALRLAAEALAETIFAASLEENWTVGDLLDERGPRERRQALGWTRDRAEVVRLATSAEGFRAEATLRLSAQEVQNYLGRGVSHPGEMFQASASWERPDSPSAALSLQAGRAAAADWAGRVLEAERRSMVPPNLWGTDLGLRAARLDALARARADLKARVLDLDAAPGRKLADFLAAQPEKETRALELLASLEPQSEDAAAGEWASIRLSLDLEKLAEIVFPPDDSVAPSPGGAAPPRAAHRKTAEAVAQTPRGERDPRSELSAEGWGRALWTAQGSHSLPPSEAADAANLARAREQARQNALGQLRGRIHRLSLIPGQSMGQLAATDERFRAIIEKALAEARSEALKESAEGVVSVSVSLEADALLAQLRQALREAGFAMPEPSATTDALPVVPAANSGSAATRLLSRPSDTPAPVEAEEVFGPEPPKGP
jgi:hypothetical protein